MEQLLLLPGKYKYQGPAIHPDESLTQGDQYGDGWYYPPNWGEEELDVLVVSTASKFGSQGWGLLLVILKSEPKKYRMQNFQWQPIAGQIIEVSSMDVVFDVTTNT